MKLKIFVITIAIRNFIYQRTLSMISSYTYIHHSVPEIHNIMHSIIKTILFSFPRQSEFEIILPGETHSALLTQLNIRSHIISYKFSQMDQNAIAKFYHSSWLRCVLIVVVAMHVHWSIRNSLCQWCNTASCLPSHQLYQSLTITWLLTVHILLIYIFINSQIIKGIVCI